MPSERTTPPNVLEVQLARVRAEQIVGELLTSLDGHPNEPLVVLLVAEQLVELGVQGIAIAGGKEKALRQAIAFVADVNRRVLEWATSAAAILVTPPGRT